MLLVQPFGFIFFWITSPFSSPEMAAFSIFELMLGKSRLKEWGAKDQMRKNRVKKGGSLPTDWCSQGGRPRSMAIQALGIWFSATGWGHSHHIRSTCLRWINIQRLYTLERPPTHSGVRNRGLIRRDSCASCNRKSNTREKYSSGESLGVNIKREGV